MSTPVKVPMLFENERLLWTIEDVYTPEECEALIQLIEAGDPEIATNNPIYRDQDRVIRDDPEMTAELFRRIRNHLPESMGELKLLGLNDRLRMYRYKAGQQFAEHTDHWYRPNDDQISLHSALLYLNDTFLGGETKFMEKVDEIVKPKPGLVAIFQHKLRHEGCVVKHGTKYAIRTDVIYGR